MYEVNNYPKVETTLDHPNHLRENPPEINAFLTGELSPKILRQYRFKSGKKQIKPFYLLFNKISIDDILF